jgi:hypothetical protein
MEILDEKLTIIGFKMINEILIAKRETNNPSDKYLMLLDSVLILIP